MIKNFIREDWRNKEKKIKKLMHESSLDRTYGELEFRHAWFVLPPSLQFVLPPTFRGLCMAPSCWDLAFLPWLTSLTQDLQPRILLASHACCVGLSFWHMHEVSSRFCFSTHTGKYCDPICSNHFWLSMRHNLSHIVRIREYNTWWASLDKILHIVEGATNKIWVVVSEFPRRLAKWWAAWLASRYMCLT